MKENYINFSDIENDIKILEKGKGEENMDIYLTSLIHGDEFAGLQYTNKIFRKINDPEEKGRVRHIPIMNPDGFIRNKREHSKYGDINRSFLNKVDINQPVQYLKHIFDKHLSKADLVIDFHSYSHEENNAYIILDRIDEELTGRKKANEVRSKLLYSSSNISLPVIEEDFTKRGYLSETLVNKSKVPSMRVELGKNIVSDYKKLESLSDEFSDFINKLFDSPEEFNSLSEFETPSNYYKRRFITTKLKGEIVPLVKEGETAEEGETICYIKSSGGKKLPIDAPEDGWLVEYSESMRIKDNKNDVCHFAIEKDEDQLIY